MQHAVLSGAIYRQRIIESCDTGVAEGLPQGLTLFTPVRASAHVSPTYVCNDDRS